MIAKIYKKPLITPSGEVKGEEYIMENCPRFCANVNVKKSCAKCPAKQKLSYKTMELDCRMIK